MVYKNKISPSLVLRVLCTGFLFGIFISSFVFRDDGSVSVIALSISIIGATLIAFFCFRKLQLDLITLMLVLVAALLTGFYLFSISFPTDKSVASITGDNVRVEGTVLHVKRTDTKQQLRLDYLTINDASYEDRILVFSPLFPRLQYGDRVAVRCDLQAPEPFDGFAYDKFLATKGVYAICFTTSPPLVIDEDMGHPLKAILMQARNGTISVIDKTFGEPHGSLLAGLLLGEQRFTNAWDDLFLKTGTTHIVAASGYNVAVVTFVLFGLLASLGVRRQRAFTIIMFGILAYVFLAGAEAPVIRAGIMGSLVLLARQLGRSSTMLNVLLLTGSVMLFVSPLLLRYDVGFQLSIISTVALIYFSPYVDRGLEFIPKKYEIREALTATLTATFFTLPIVFLSFGRLAIIAPFVNLLILPVLPYTMVFGAVSVFGGIFSSSVGAFLSGPAWALLGYMLWVIKSMAELPFASFEIPPVLFVPLAILSTIIICLVWYRLSKKATKKS
ncbi:MAG: ComEC/Rec2 family competence protein [Candidatus Uhrbacteria bacterium]|nr:ComEC/Rec2 family competence protein [Candidatus Uhrbacteria bacterium]